MNSRFSVKIIILCEIFAVLAPFFLIAFFCYPVGDDYYYGQVAYNLWVRQHDRSMSSIIYLVKHALEITSFNWKYARGEYSSFIFSCLMPSAFGDHTTWINVWLLIGASAAAIWKFINVIFGRWLRICDKYICIYFPLVLLYIVSYLPSVSQGYYWFNGGFYNLFITSVGIIYMVDCIYNVLCETDISRKRQLGIVFLAWIVGGGNYATILVLCILLFLLLVYSFYDNRKISRCWLKYSIPLYIFSGINLLAPCNLNRTWETERSYFETIMDSLVAVPEVYGPWLIRTPFIFLLLITGIFAWNNMEVWGGVRSRKRIHPVFLIILTYLLAAAMICPVLYAQGFWGKGRVYNVYYMLFTLLVIFDWVYTIRYIKLLCADGKYRYSKVKSGYLINILLTIILVSSMFLGKHTVYILQSNIESAYANLLDGRVFRYGEVMEERLRIYAENQNEEVTVPRLKEDYSLYLYYDLKNSKDEWPNDVVAEYYGVAAVTPE